MNLADIDARLTQAELALERERGVVAALASKGQHALDEVAKAIEEAAAHEEAAKLLAEYSDEKQAEIIKTIEQITSIGLSQVFDEPIELTITPVVRARRVELDIKVRTGTLETPILEARGGGLAAVAGFLLRACVVLLKPDARRLLVLDEVFAMLSEDYLSRMAEFLRTLCEETGLQIILVTHQDEFKDAAHTVYRIEKTGHNTARFVEES